MNSENPHILVVGSLNADLITRTRTMPAAGETITASSFSTGSGGKGANQAVACARAAQNSKAARVAGHPALASVSMIGAVGDDVYGHQLLDELSSNGINMQGIQKVGDEVTGVAVILVEESTGQNRILITPGANNHVLSQAFDSFVSLVGQPDVVVLQLEIPLDTVLAVIESSKKLGIDVILNPAPAVPLPNEYLKGLNHLILNETEAGILTELGGDCVDEKSLLKVFSKFHELGVLNTIVTLGGAGVAYQTGPNQFAQIPAEKVERVVDTTAAGDTFVGTFAVEVALSKVYGTELEVLSAVRKANKAAARTVQRVGAMSSIPWKDEV